MKFETLEEINDFINKHADVCFKYIELKIVEIDCENQRWLIMSRIFNIMYQTHFHLCVNLTNEKIRELQTIITKEMEDKMAKKTKTSKKKATKKVTKKK